MSRNVVITTVTETVDPLKHAAGRDRWRSSGRHNHGYRTVDPLKPLDDASTDCWQADHNHGYRDRGPIEAQYSQLAIHRRATVT